MLDLIDHAHARELRLSRPPVNALNPAIVAALDAAIKQAAVDGPRFLVLSGRPGLFSGGLDVPALLKLDEASLAIFFQSFFGLLNTLASSPIPIVAAITGHSPAGGAVLSLFCDYRVMATGDFKIGLNEVQVGLFVPAPIQAALRRLIGPHRAERMMVAGAMLSAAQAHELGLVDELAPVEFVVERALAWCGQHSSLPPQALARTRQMARADLVASTREGMDSGAMSAGWWGEETQSVLRRLFPPKV